MADSRQARERLADARQLWRTGRLAEAEQAYRQALAHHPNLAEAQNELGSVLHAQGKLPDAEAAFAAAIRLEPRLAAAYSNASRLFRQQNRLSQAIHVARAGLCVMPSMAALHYNLGSALLAADKPEEAIEHFQLALAGRGDHVQSWNELGQAHKACGRYSEAAACYERALHLDPKSPEVHVNQAILLLLRGYLREGFAEYEWRWRSAPFAGELARHAAPLWDGSDLSGKAILIHAEQGLGDTIQFARYAKLLKQRGAKRIIFAAQKPLVNLMKNVADVDHAIERGAAPGEHDWQCPLLSLPNRLATTLETIPRNVPYVFATPDRIEAWNTRLGGGNALKLGLVWSSNSNNPEGRRKCCPLEQFAALSALEPMEIHSLQLGTATRDLTRATLPFEVHDWSAEFGDFADTAALVANLDAVISVDTAVAHLAGAMGCKTFTLLARDADWRWLIDRADSPWYPTMRLIRQPSAGDWDAVMHQLVDELLHWRSTRREPEPD